jgi:putative ABC transport system permease protein
MLKFILKGIFRDRHRYLFPLFIVAAGVLIVGFATAMMEGYTTSFIRHNSRFETGHMKVVTKAYAEMLSQKPYDLGLDDLEARLQEWRKAFPELEWAPRINFGALLDVPDSLGETRDQGEVLGFSADLFGTSKEIERLRLRESLIQGKLPASTGEILITDLAFTRLKLKLGDTVTLIASTAGGAMTMRNFCICGTFTFGVETLDRGAVLADISDIRALLEMENGAGEVLAYFKDGKYDPKRVRHLSADFNRRFSAADEYAPLMLGLEEQGNMGYWLGVMRSTTAIMGFVLVLVLGIVLWNSGLMNGIRRWGEFGVRLAIGERKSHVYRALLMEALVIGIVGSLIGALVGLVISLYFSTHGMDMSAYNRNSSVLAENVIYTTVNLKNIIISIIPGVLSTLLGAALAGIAIFKRQTSQLFKELEV